MTIRWGILGCGDVCEVKSGPAFSKVEGSELVAVMRRDAGLAEDYARRHNVPRWYDSAEALIADEEVDAVYIATPPGSHRDYAVQVARAGKPAYVEKPMARNHRECQEMIAAFREAKLPLFVAYYRRAQPRFVQAKELIDSGVLGKITGIDYVYETPPLDADESELPWRVVAEHSGGGLFFDLGSHALDMLDFLIGPLHDVQGIAANRLKSYQAEDGVALHFRTEGGALGTAVWNFAAATRNERLEIVGTTARLSCPAFSLEPITLTSAEGTKSWDFDPLEHVQQPLIETVVAALLGRGTCPSTGESAARTSLAMDRAVETFYGNRDLLFE